jgi:hypothetical protein
MASNLLNPNLTLRTDCFTATAELRRLGCQGASTMLPANRCGEFLMADSAGRTSIWHADRFCSSIGPKSDQRRQAAW